MIVFWLLMLAYKVGALIGNDCEFTKYRVMELVLRTMSVQPIPLPKLHVPGVMLGGNVVYVYSSTSTSDTMSRTQPYVTMKSAAD